MSAWVKGSGTFVRRRRSRIGRSSARLATGARARPRGVGGRGCSSREPVYRGDVRRVSRSPGSRRPAPSLNNRVSARPSDGFLQYAIHARTPQHRMPGFAGKLDPSTVDDLVLLIRNVHRSRHHPTANSSQAGHGLGTCSIRRAQRRSSSAEDATWLPPTCMRRCARDAACHADARPPGLRSRTHAGAVNIPFFDYRSRLSELPGTAPGSWSIAAARTPSRASCRRPASVDSGTRPPGRGCLLLAGSRLSDGGLGTMIGNCVTTGQSPALRPRATCASPSERCPSPTELRGRVRPGILTEVLPAAARRRVCNHRSLMTSLSFVPTMRC